MEEHIKAILCRIILTVMMAVSLPEAHVRWGASPEAAGIEGPTAFAIFLSMAAWSTLVAFGYFLVGGLVQFFFRRRLRISFYYDVGVGLLLIALGVLAGIMAEYHNAAP